MAKIFNKLIDSMKLDDDYDEFEPDDEFDLDYNDDIVSNKYSKSSPSYDSELDLDDDFEEEPSTAKSFFRPKKQQPASVVPMRKSTNMEVVMQRPSSLIDSKEICDVLLSGRAVVINMEGVNLELAQRIVDFVSGACYSMNGNLSSISKYIFIATPSNIELSGEFSTSLAGGSNSIKMNM